MPDLACDPGEKLVLAHDANKGIGDDEPAFMQMLTHMHNKLSIGTC